MGARVIGPLALLAAGALLTGCPGPRPDDGYEPNDTFEQATRLTLASVIDARINQDDADVFVIQAEPGLLLFLLEDRGLENCAVFRVHDAARTELLGQDPTSNCGPDGTRLATGVSFSANPDGGYLISVPIGATGDVYLTILEDSEADNIAPFSWDYRLTVGQAVP